MLSYFLSLFISKIKLMFAVIFTNFISAYLQCTRASTFPTFITISIILTRHILKTLRIRFGGIAPFAIGERHSTPCPAIAFVTASRNTALIRIHYWHCCQTNSIHYSNYNARAKVTLCSIHCIFHQFKFL